MAPSSAEKYKIKLASGRVLGPIGLDRIRLFILKEQIVGRELARAHPVGEWVDINSIPSIAELLVAKASGSLSSMPSPAAAASSQSPLGTTRMIDQPTTPMPSISLASGPYPLNPKRAPDRAQDRAQESAPPTDAPSPVDEDDKTVISIEPGAEGSEDSNPSEHSSDWEGEASDSDPTMVMESGSKKKGSRSIPSLSISKGKGLTSGSSRESTQSKAVAEQPTVMMEKPFGEEQWGIQDAIKDPRKLQGAVKNSVRDLKTKIVGALATLSVLFIVYTMLDQGASKDVKESLWVPVRPTVPRFDLHKKDPPKAADLYKKAVQYYIKDNVVAYKHAADNLTLAVQYDNSNVKALALLASAYLNLIDSSNKDENYFSVISKLIELSRASNLELPETVIADVEFYITVNKAEAAENRIVEYTKTQTQFGTEMFYYLALAFFHRGDAQSAVRYISEYPENRAFSPKVFYLRGQIAEKLGDPTAAIQEYEKAIKQSPEHAKSRLAIARILDSTHQLQNAATHLEYIAKHTYLLAPKDLAEAYYLDAQLNQLFHKDEVALNDMARAVKLEPRNHSYLLAFYALQAKLGEDVKLSRSRARMYYFLGEGEKYLKEGKYHEALTQFLQALQAENKSPLPFVKIGDMYLHQNELSRAMDSYQKAAERAPTNIEVWSKYIDTLIQSYEWKKAMDAMDKFRKLDVPQSAIDKAAADMYARQGDYTQAQQLYRKAMARDSIDSGVYIAYAKTLMELKNFKEASYFFALAMRFDPLNVDAMVGSARCIAATASIDHAINFLQDELQKGTAARAELLAAIGEFQIQKGAWAQAEQYVDQALSANPDYAFPYKLRAKIFLNRETEKGMIEKALDAYNSYSERNSSDPSGYLERYRIFIRKGEFDKADDELRKIYGIYPKYPNLHFYKGALYSIMGNQQKAMEEFGRELENNQNSVASLLAYGKELVKVGNPQQAIKKFERAMQLAPKSAEAKGEAAYASYLIRNYYGAVALFNAALRLDPGNSIFYRRLALTYRDMGDRNAAQEAFRKFGELDPDAANKVDLDSLQ